MRTRHVINKATLDLVVTNKTQRHAVTQWDVDKTFSEVTDVAALGLLHAKTNTTLEPFGARLVCDDSDGARLCVRTIGRTLRASQDLNPSHIVNVRVQILTHGRHRLLIEIHRDRWVSA